MSEPQDGPSQVSEKIEKKKPKALHHRVNYEDPSLKFLDWVDSVGIEKTFLGRWLQFLEDRFYLKKSAVIFLFCIALSYLIFYQIELKEDLVVGEVATQDVVSPLSFEMIDEVTTEDKKQKAEAGSLAIYDFDTNVVDRVQQKVIYSFRVMRNITNGLKLPASGLSRQIQLKEGLQYKTQFETDLGVPVTDPIFEWLMDRGFSDRIESAILRNIEDWYQYKIADTPERYIPSSQSEVVLRVVHKNNLGREFNAPKDEIRDLQNTENFKLQDTRGLERFTASDRQNIEFLAQSLIVPNLTFNRQETALRKEAARSTVLPVNIAIKKNQTIISQGTPVQPFQMAILKQIETIQADRKKDGMAISMAFLLSISVLVFFSYLRRFTQTKIKVEFKDIAVMMVITFAIVLLTKTWLFISDAAFVSKLAKSIPPSFFLFAAPVAAGPMMVGLLITYGEVVWLFTAFLAMSLGIMVDFNFAFMIVTFVGGIAAARGVYGCKTRNDIYWAGVRAGIINALMIGFILFISKFDQEIVWKEVLWPIPAGFLGGIFSSLVAMMFIPLLESLFNYTTDVKLLELSNLNHPLLKDMIVKAPGTYHHSMMVGSMVEAAAEEIGANPLLGKVMCYYHDIGKMEHAKYFIENQKPGQNPHDHISPFMSKTLLIAHVKDGVELGMAHKLGTPIIDGVLQHHGTTLISFFYNRALDQKEEGDVEIPEEEFRYPGPKPQFREAALCMLADSIEAAARSLDEPTPTRLQNIVRNVIQRKFSDGQLDECNLTLKDLSKVETAFVRILWGIYHQRIDYPRTAGGGLGDAVSTKVSS